MTFRKLLLPFILGFCGSAAFGQSEVIDVPVYRYQEPAPYFKSGDTLDLPFQDDFSGEASFPDQEKWSDFKALVNNNFCAMQWSRGVVTLDGLDEGGKAYNINKNSSDTLADVLTSQYIDLSAATSPYLNFIYQEGGLGDIPEKEDSLVVDFWNVDSARWERVWSVRGGEMEQDQWKWAAVSADNPRWLKDGFRFRIGNYGALNGSFDIWNIDYLSLESGRTILDTTISDPAITQPHPVLINNFTQMPWFHMNATQYPSQINMKYRRNGPPPVDGWSLNLGKYRMYQDGNEIASRTTVPVITNLDHNVEREYQVPLDFSQVTLQTAPTNLEIVSWYDGEAVGIRKNDSLRYVQRFDNVYAFDDGTAEQVYGLTDANSYILIRFQPPVSDTLKGLQMFFGQAKEDISRTPFRIVVFNFQNNGPGSILYESDSLYYPRFIGGNNQFGTYTLDTSGIYINGTVYIGVKQISATPLTIGLDRNTDSLTQLIYGDGSNWYPSLEYPIALMMRPYFRYHPTDISVSEPTVDRGHLSIYPNPTDGAFVIEAGINNPTPARLFDLNGRMVWEGPVHDGSQVNPGILGAGLYILHVYAGDEVLTAKVIIQ